MIDILQFIFYENPNLRMEILIAYYLAKKKEKVRSTTWSNFEISNLA